MNETDLTERELVNFISLPYEKLLLSQRQHWITLALGITGIVITVLFLTAAAAFAIYYITHSLLLTVSVTVLLYSLMVSLIVQRVVLWYYHFYIVTNRKILEVSAVPFQSDTINDVFLEQVRTTEVDIQINSFWHELFNMGDIAISFDRPSHDTLFILKNINNPKTAGMFLADALEEMMNPSKVWFQRGNRPEHIKFTEDISQGESSHEGYAIS